MNDRLLKLEKQSIERFKAFEPGNGYYVAYSGGKDSDVIRILAQLAGVKHVCKHNLTTVDPLPSVYYVWKTIGKENVEYPDTTMWKLIVDQGMPPTRVHRYCCEYFKEGKGQGKLVVTGVRWEESVKRKQNSALVQINTKPSRVTKFANFTGADYQKTNYGIILNDDNDASRRVVEYCYRTSKTIMNPILEWTEKDVWEFLHHYGCEGNPLYQCGYKRVGCIGCPMATTHRFKEFEDFPKYKEAYIRTFDRMLKFNSNKNYKYNWRTGQDVFDWWMQIEKPKQRLFTI